MNKKFRNKLLGMTMVTAVAGSLFSAPDANAYNGTEDPAKGIVWGVNQDGTYMIPTKEGELEGFCIDPGKAYPKMNGSTNYGDPHGWGKELSIEQKKQLITALLIAKAWHDPEWDGIRNQIKQFLPMAIQNKNLVAKIPGSEWLANVDIPADIANYDKNNLYAGVSAVVHEVGDNGPGGTGGAKWKTQGFRGHANPQSATVYDKIMSEAPKVPNMFFEANLGLGSLADFEFQIRAPEDGSNKQRMIAIPDINIKLPTLPPLPPLPPIDFPPPRTSTTKTTKTTTTKTTKTTKTTTTPPKTTTKTTQTTSTERSKTPPSTPPSTKTTVTTVNKHNVELRTSAGEKNGNLAIAGEKITDTVTYSGVEPGKKYKLVAETVDKETETLLGNVGETEFTPESTQGEVDVDIQLETVGEGDIVVFETLYDISDGSEKKVAEHKDVNDNAQTVKKPELKPEIRTMAESSTGNVIQPNTTIKDTVSYDGLVKGKEYRLEARLMNKLTGADTGAVKEHTFTAEDVAGTTVVDGIQVTDPTSTQQVVFEKLYDTKTNELIASHEDITDAAQTVGGQTPPAPIPSQVVQKQPDVNKIIPNLGEKKKKKVAPAPQPAAPAPGGAGGGGGAGGVAPRQVIAAVPSGETSGYGHTIFDR